MTGCEHQDAAELTAQAVAVQLKGATAPTTADPYISHYRLGGRSDSIVARFYWTLTPPVAITFVREEKRVRDRKARWARLDQLCQARGWVHVVMPDETLIANPGAEAAGVPATVPPKNRYADLSEFG